MDLLCEDFVKDILPAVRALLTKDLLEKYDLTQNQAAKKLDMTQPAISQYKNKLRGKKAKRLESSEKISGMINNLAERIANDQIDMDNFDEELCDICEKAKEESLLPDSTCKGS